MIITSRKKCFVCEDPVTEVREFLITIDMFDPNPVSVLKGDLLKEIKKWRSKKVFCDIHTGADMQPVNATRTIV